MPTRDDPNRENGESQRRGAGSLHHPSQADPRDTLRSLLAVGSRCAEEIRIRATELRDENSA